MCIILILYVDDLRIAGTTLVMLLEDIHVGDRESHVLPRDHAILIVVIPKNFRSLIFDLHSKAQLST